MKKLDGIDKVYLAGPMSGHIDYGFPVFNAAAQQLRELGYVVLNPAETAGGASHLEREWYFRFDFAVIANVDAIFLLPGWKDSAGAKAEVVYANEIGLGIYELTVTNGNTLNVNRVVVRSVDLDASIAGVYQGPF